MDFENYVKANDAVLKNVQNQGQNLQNQMANVTSLLTSLCNNFKNSDLLRFGYSIQVQTVTNPREQINAITTRSGKTCEGPSTPLVPTPVVSTPQKESNKTETSTRLDWKDGLVEMLKFNKWLARCKEPRRSSRRSHYNVNVKCSAIIMTKFPRSSKDPVENFFYPMCFQELDRTKCF
ncbi:hypothetical protein Tco_0303465 [Tanacetum coccineum]